MPFPPRGEADLGLALSGGGLRSALFSIGVMKALYDAGLLDRLDVLSSVSGGGYASYWLYRGQLEAAPGTRFGAPRLADSVFARSVCQLQSLGNFQTVLSMLDDARQGRSFDGYQAAIQRTFGYDDAGTSDMPIQAAREAMRRGDAPFFIMNASIDDPARQRLSNSLEITSEYMGSPTLGIHPWRASPDEPTWAHAAAISGAAVGALKQKIALPSRPDSSLVLWDGGKSENLAALALLRRKLPTVIIVDAEMDADYRFEGYERLRHLLPLEGIHLAIPQIDDFLGTVKTGENERRAERRARFGSAAVAQGTARHADGMTTQVFYVKMSIPNQLRSEFTESSARYISGAEQSAAFEQLLERANGEPFDKCEALEGHPGNGDHSRFVYEVTEYGSWLRGSWHGRMGRLLGGFTRYDFPHMTTVDQSYYTDQAAALIGLGYLQASAFWKSVQE